MLRAGKPSIAAGQLAQRSEALFASPSIRSGRTRTDSSLESTCSGSLIGRHAQNDSVTPWIYHRNQSNIALNAALGQTLLARPGPVCHYERFTGVAEWVSGNYAWIPGVLPYLQVGGLNVVAK